MFCLALCVSMMAFSMALAEEATAAETAAAATEAEATAAAEATATAEPAAPVEFIRTTGEAITLRPRDGIGTMRSLYRRRVCEGAVLKVVGEPITDAQGKVYYPVHVGDKGIGYIPLDMAEPCDGPATSAFWKEK